MTGHWHRCGRVSAFVVTGWMFTGVGAGGVVALALAAKGAKRASGGFVSQKVQGRRTDVKE